MEEIKQKRELVKNKLLQASENTGKGDKNASAVEAVGKMLVTLFTCVDSH